MPRSWVMSGLVRSHWRTIIELYSSCVQLLTISFVADVKVRANVATELRDSIEPLCSGANYPIFLAKLWPIFKTILSGEPVFFSMSYEQVRMME